MFTIPTFTLPPLFARVGSRLPQWPHAVGLVTALNVACKLELLPTDSLDAFTDKVLLVAVNDSGSEARFTWRDGAFRPLFGSQTADVAFRANLAAFLQLINRQEDPDTLFFNRQLLIEGDTELGLLAKNLLDAIDWQGAMQSRWPQLARWLPAMR